MAKKTRTKSYSDKSFIVIGTHGDEDIEKATMAFACAGASGALGIKTKIFLTGNGVKLAQKGSATKLPGGGNESRSRQQRPRHWRCQNRSRRSGRSQGEPRIREAQDRCDERQRRCGEIHGSRESGGRPREERTESRVAGRGHSRAERAQAARG